MKFAKSFEKNLKKHIYVQRQQHACDNKLKKELGENEVLLHVLFY